MSVDNVVGTSLLVADQDLVVLDWDHTATIQEMSTSG